MVQLIGFEIGNYDNSISADLADNEAMTAIYRVTNGNFRVTQRLFKQIERIMKINNLKSITAEVVDAARECLVIGKL